MCYPQFANASRSVMNGRQSYKALVICYSNEYQPEFTMSHIFSLDQLAQHKVCLDFSDSERPPSVQWHALSKPFDSRSPSSSLSIRIDASKLNGGNTLTLFVVEDSETPVAGPSRRSSAPPQVSLPFSDHPGLTSKAFWL